MPENQGVDEIPQTFASVGFPKGANQRDPLETMDPSFARYLENCDVSTPGKIKKCAGTTLIADEATASSVVGGVEYRPFGSLPIMFRELENATIESLAPGEATWMSSKTSDSSLHPDQDPCYKQIRNQIYRFSKVDPALYYDGSNWISVGLGNSAIPQGNISLWFKSRLFIANQNDLWFSNAADPRTFDQRVNAFKVDEGDRSIITGLAPFRSSSVIVTKEFSVHELIVSGATPLTDWVLRPIDETVGSLCAPAIGPNNKIFILSSDGVRELLTTENDTSIAQPVPLSNNIPDWIDSINWEDQKAVKLSRMWVFDNKLNVCVPFESSKVPNVILQLDLITGAWTKRTHHKVGVWIESVRTGKNKLYFGERDGTSRVLEFNRGVDFNGTNIPMEIVTGFYGKEGQQHTFQELGIDAEGTDSTTLTVEARINQEAYTTLVNENDTNMDLAGSGLDLTQTAPFTLRDGNVVKEKFNIDGKIDPNEGRYIQYRIKESTSAKVILKNFITRAFVESYELQED